MSDLLKELAVKNKDIFLAIYPKVNTKLMDSKVWRGMSHEYHQVAYAQLRKILLWLAPKLREIEYKGELDSCIGCGELIGLATTLGHKDDCWLAQVLRLAEQMEKG